MRKVAVRILNDTVRERFWLVRDNLDLSPAVVQRRRGGREDNLRSLKIARDCENRKGGFAAPALFLALD